MGFAMQCSSYGTCISICVPHRFPQTPLSFHVPAYHWNRFKSARKNQRMMVLCSVDDRSNNLGSQRKRFLSLIAVALSIFHLSSSEFPLSMTVLISCRKIVEHVCLLKAKQDLSEDEENDMLDYLYTTQYQMGGVVAISLGRISAPNPERYTHALFMRFQKKENLEKFYDNPFYLKVLKDHVMTYCHGLTNVDYESEVADEMLSIFRKGEEFNHGVEFVLLISFNEDALGNQAEHALASLASMMLESPSLIVQFTHGLNFSPSSKEYTHGVVIRFRSVEAFEIFINSKEYKNQDSKLSLNLKNRHGIISSSLLSTNLFLFTSLLIQWELKLCSEDGLWFSRIDAAWFPLFRNKNEGRFIVPLYEIREAVEKIEPKLN
ncbi:Stress-response A/B barrel domain-containing protein UP3 [Glycine soja]